jgi:hypothetical protein
MSIDTSHSAGPDKLGSDGLGPDSLEPRRLGRPGVRVQGFGPQDLGLSPTVVDDEDLGARIINTCCVVLTASGVYIGSLALLLNW